MKRKEKIRGGKKDIGIGKGVAHFTITGRSVMLYGSEGEFAGHFTVADLRKLREDLKEVK